MTAVVAALGGPGAIRIAVQGAYLRLGADPVLAPLLREVDGRRVRTHMTELLEAADGRFDRLADTLGRLGAAPLLADAIVADLRPLHDEVVMRSAAFTGR